MPDLPFLDLRAPGFATRSDDVLKARDASWCARTPYGYAVLRHREAGLLLRDRRLRQGSYAWPDRVYLEGAFSAFWRRSVISLEGDAHKALRRLAQTALAPEFVRALHPRFVAIAEDLLASLKQRPTVEFISDFSEPFAGLATAELLGAPPAMAHDLARDASRLGLAMGLDARQHQNTINSAYQRLFHTSLALIDTPPTHGFVPRLLEAARSARVEDRMVLSDLIVISIFGGVDTTRAQLGFAIYLLATHLDQWHSLQDDPSCIPQALDEVIRTRPTTTWATREAIEDFEFGEVAIHAGDTLHIFVHASSTEPEPDSSAAFDIHARRKPHFGFGGGSHHCLGHHVARTDMAAALRVLLRRWSSVRLAGDPEFLPESGNTSLKQLVVTPEWA